MRDSLAVGIPTYQVLFRIIGVMRLSCRRMGTASFSPSPRVSWLWLAALLVLPEAGRAEEAPLWESGLGVAVMRIPSYRGSDTDHTYVLPIPYLVYRGDLLKVDRHGVHGDILRTDGVKLDVSLGAGPPAKSNENSVRAGMPDIDPTLEAGPSLKIRLLENAARDRRLTLQLPVRAVIATDLSHFDHIGWVFTPNLNYDMLHIGPGGGWNLGMAAGPIYATEDNHDYYYEVRPEYATPTRPAYEARGGYSGARATVTLSKRFPRFWVGGFLRYDTLSNAVIEDSPLVRKGHSFMAGVGVSWIFSVSEKRVTLHRTDDPP
jgi:outer membrane scaffolding protein for murein synthesis (MipA/OmpV family)